MAFKNNHIFLLLVAIFYSLATTTGQEPKFSEIVDTLLIGRHFENLTVHHPFYVEVGLGTLPLRKFMAMTQQDDLYVQNYFKVFLTMLERETDPARKQILLDYGSENWDEYFNIYYTKFNFTPPVQMVPDVLAYVGAQSIAAKYDDIGVALATTYPCYTVWAKMGEHIAQLADLPNNPDHPYREFIEANSGSDGSLLEAYIRFVDGYYERLGNNTAIKKRMLDAYVRSVQYEFQFAEINYKSEPETVPPPRFSDLVEMVTPGIQSSMVYHNFFTEIARGTLLLDKYAVLIQQDHIYLRGFYKAFELMEHKETDPQLKALLRKDGTSRYQWMEDQYDFYGFGPASRTESYTEEYINHMRVAAEYGSVAEGLASAYPCYLLWDKMGYYVTFISNYTSFPEHPYKMFLESQDPSQSTSLARMNSLINGYFDRLGDDIEEKVKMFDAVRRSVNYEFLFINGIYQFGTFEVNGREL